VKDIVVFGSWKEFAQVIFDINASAGKDIWNIVAIGDEDPALMGKDWHKIPFVDWDWIETKKGNRFAHCCVGKTIARKRICDRLSANGYELPNIISPSAIVSHLAELGGGNLICANVQIHPDVHIGNCNMFNVGTHVAHDVQVGNYCTINSQVNLVEKCRVDDMAYVGAGTTVIKSAWIGAGATIGANALVNRNVPESETWVGVPARPIKNAQGDLN
jgi:sugar O-acyltransferase (sialic acid O-acetyltransferase NeuD family)